MCCSCGWALGAQMTKFSTDWAGVHGACMLRVSRGNSLTERAYILGAMRVYVFQGLTLETLYDSRGGLRFRGVQDSDRVTGSGFHNHLQSSRECNMSSAYSRSTSLVNLSPTSLSQSSITTILFSGGEERCGSRSSREGVCFSGQLGGRVDCGVSQGERVGRGGSPCGLRGLGISRSSRECPILLLLQNLLLYLVTTIVTTVLLL